MPTRIADKYVPRLPWDARYAISRDDATGDLVVVFSAWWLDVDPIGTLRDYFHGVNHGLCPDWQYVAGECEEVGARA